MSLWSPPPKLSISEWADTYRMLSREGSAEPGKWRTSRAEYQRELMNAIKENERIVIMTAAQVGKTELLLNTLGYFVDKEPSPMLIVQPTLQMGEDFSRNRLYPMLRDTPCLSEKIPLKTRNTNNNILYKKFANDAFIAIAGANSPAGLASRSVRVLLCDEVDRYPDSAGDEGDPLSLAMRRTSNFWNRRIVWVSTPTLLGASRIEKAYELSTREEWCVPCPKCGEYQAYSWEHIVYVERTEPVMKCVSCGYEGTEHEWKRGTGRWIAGKTEDSHYRGFHMNAFASPWVTWQELITQHEEAKVVGEEAMKAWTNTVLGETYELKEGSIDVEQFTTHVEEYSAIVPDEVQVLTAGVDTQDNRLEVEVLGWGPNYETWGIEYRILYGSPGGFEVWDNLEEYLTRLWVKSDGQELGISCACIDSGGHFTDYVYRFAQKHVKQRFYAIVGRGGFGHPSISGPTRNNRRHVPLFTLGVSTLKGMLFSRLQAEKGEPGYCHFPKDKRSGYDAVYFKGLLSERMVIRRRNGRDVIDWEKRSGIKRNEPLDTRVYAMGAYEILNPKILRPKSESEKDSSVKREKNPAKIYRRPQRLIRRITL